MSEPTGRLNLNRPQVVEMNLAGRLGGDTADRISRNPLKETDAMNEPVLNLEEAAHLLGYSTRAMRTLINRSKRRPAGMPVKGPTIKFFQPDPRASIRFRREWLAEFVRQNTVDPTASPLIGSVPRKLPASPAVTYNRDRLGTL